MELNLILFITEALVTNKKIEKDIINMYEEHKYEAYKAAKKSKFYNHPILSDGDIYREVLCKKALGLLLLAQADENVTVKVQNMIEKGWRGICSYVSEQEKLDLDSLLNKFAGKGNTNNLTNDEFNAIFIVGLVCSEFYKISIIENKTYRFIIESLYNRLVSYNKDPELDEYKSRFGLHRFSYKQFNQELRDKSKSILERIFDRYGVIRNIDSFTFIDDEEMEDYVDKMLMVFDTEDMMISSMAENIKIDKKEMQELAGLYYVIYRNQNTVEAAKFFYPAFIIRMILKAYKDVKSYFFKNNKETLYIELEGLEDKVRDNMETVNRFKTENNSLKNEIEHLRDSYKKTIERENLDLKGKIEDLENKIRLLKQNDKELFALREAIFELNQDIDPEDTAEKQTREIPDIKALVVGGHKNWREKLALELPDTFSFLDGTIANFDVNILNNVEYVFLYTGYMSHATYYRIISHCKNSDVSINYITHTSIDLVLDEIARKL